MFRLANVSSALVDNVPMSQIGKHRIRKYIGFSYPAEGAIRRSAQWALTALLTCFPVVAVGQRVQQIAGVTAIGQSTPYTVTVTVNASGTAAAPVAVTGGVENSEFSIGTSGSCLSGTQYSAGQQCTVAVLFTPKYPGLRSGAVVVKTPGGALVGIGLVSGRATGSLPVLTPGRIDTVAGNGQWTYTDDGAPATATPIFTPQGLIVDPAGNLYLSDTGNNRIRRVDTQTGTIATIAGTGMQTYSGDGGPAVSAGIGSPAGVALDGAGNLYFADTQNDVIRRIDAVSRNITTVAGTPQVASYGGDNGAATAAQLNLPRGVAFDLAGNLLIVDSGNHALRRVDAVSGNIVTLAGDGTGGFNGDNRMAGTARLNTPSATVALPDGSILIADTGNNRIRRIDLSGMITTVVGTGVEGYSGDGSAATAAMIKGPIGLAFDPVGNLYVADSGNNRVRMVSAADGTIATLTGTESEGFSGDGGPANLASLYGPFGLQFTQTGDLLVSDMFHMRIRRISGSNVRLTYPTLRRGKTSAPQLQGLANYGSTALQLSAPIPVYSGLDASTTTCSTTSSLAPSAICTLGVEFMPTVIGSDVMGSLSLPSNAANVTPVINVDGQVLDVNPTSVAVIADINPSTLYSPVIFTATVTSDDHQRTGTVTFLSDGSTLCSQTLGADGTAACKTSSLALGPHTITAQYTGDAQNASASSSAVTETIKQQTNVVVSASPNPSVVTNSVTLTVSASAATGTPTGTATIYDGTTNIGNVTLNAGQAQLAISTLLVGSHSLWVRYNGDAADAAGQSAMIVQTVQQAATIVTLATSNARVNVGTPITLIASVASTSGPAPTGNVQFQEGSTVYGSASLQPEGKASFTFAALTPGTHHLVAVYDGDTNSETSSSAALTEVTQQIGSTIALTSDANPLNAGATLHLSAQVTPERSTNPDGLLTGKVTFTDGGTTLGTVPLTAGLTAALDVQLLSVGQHAIMATYSGNTNYAAGSDTLMQNVVKTSASIAAGSASITTLAGKPAGFLANVSSSTGTPTGTVTFWNGTTPVGTATLNAQGSATLSVDKLSVGQYSTTAAYNGDSNYLPVTSQPWVHTVSLAISAVTLSGPSAAVDVTANVAFSSMLSSPGVAPTGKLTLMDGNTAISSQPVTNAGNYKFSSANLAIGRHSLAVAYSGDADNASSISAAITVVVQQAPTTTTLATSSSPSVLGTPVSLTATTDSAIANLAGTVNFQDGAQLLGSAALRNGTAMLSNVTLPFGVHTLTAVYLGDTNHAGSISAPVQQSIVQHIAVSLVSTLNPSNSGQSVVFTAALSAIAGLVPSGTVVFKEDGVVLGTVALETGGVARLRTDALAVGAHAISVDYSGDSNYSAASASQSQLVRNSTTQTIVTGSADPAVYGNPFTLTATVTSNGGVGTGQVHFSEGGGPIGDATLNGAGLAVLTVTTLRPGLHTVLASYAGDGKASASAAVPLSFLIKQRTTLLLSTAENPALTLNSIAITASLTNQHAAPATGAIIFTEGAVTLGTIPLDASGSATLTLPSLAAGTHLVSASYAGDDADFAATAPVLSQTVQRRSTMATLTSAATNTADPQQITLIAIVQSPTLSATTPPGGTVAFIKGNATVGTANVDSAGVATVSIHLEGQSSESLVASYSGDVSYAASTSLANTVTAGPAPQFILVVSDQKLVLQRGQKTTVTVTVASVKGFNDNLDLGCVGLPYAATCSFSKRGIVLGANGSGTLQLTLDTGDPLGSGASTTASAQREPVPQGAILCLLPAAALLCGLRKRHRWQLLAAFVAVSVATLGAAGCSGLQTNSTPAGVYTFQVTAIGQGTGATQAQTVTLTVQQ